MAGFGAVVEDNIYDDARWVHDVAATPCHLVVLQPRAQVVAARDAHRRRATGTIA